MRRSVFIGEPTVVGLDLSLRASAACAVPVKWDHDMAKVRTTVVGYGVSDDDAEDASVVRLDFIATKLVDFCRSNHATYVAIEEYAFSQAQSRAHALGELGGVVKRDLYKHLGLVAKPVVASHARKTLLQKLPSSRGQKTGFLKKWVGRNVKLLGGPALRWTDDEIDAFVCVNEALLLVGSIPMSFLGGDVDDL